MGVHGRSTLESALLKAWVGKGGLATVLWPISLVYQLLAWMRRTGYRIGLLKIRRVDATVIVVGNIIVGGAGKTPTVISIAQHLKAQGRKVGIISRGYGRQGEECTEVMADSKPCDVGDEPVLMHKATRVPVFVGRRRFQAATALLAAHPGTEVIVCDDGLQHYGLHRDLEVCVFDDRGCGNGWLLPAGPLREHWPRPTRPQVGPRSAPMLVLHTGRTPAFPGHTAQRSLAPLALRQDGTTTPTATLHTNHSKPLMAVAGIAQPEAFFAMLRALGLPLAHTLALSDHYDFDSWSRNIYAGYQLICTEKDAFKLWAVVPDALAVPLVQAIDAPFFQSLDSCMAEHPPATLSSDYGHKTT